MNANIEASGLFSSSTLLDYSGPQSSFCLSHYLHERRCFVHVWIHLKESGLQRERRYWPTAGGRSASVGWHHKLPAALYPLHQFFRWVGRSIQPRSFTLFISSCCLQETCIQFQCVRINRLRESGLNGMFEGGWATERRELHFSEVQVPPPVCHVPASSLKEPKHVVLSWKGQCSRHFHRNQKFTETFRRFKLYFV